jgi:hypothetical protein
MATGITVTSNPDPAQLENLGVTSWPTWGCGVSAGDLVVVDARLSSTWDVHDPERKHYRFG